MKIRQFIDEFINYILLGIFFIGLIILYAGIQANPIFIAIGFIILLPFGIWFLINRIKLKRGEKADIERIKNLKKIGDKVSIDFDKIEIKSNSWQQEIETGSGYHKRLEKININYNRIELEIPYKGKMINYHIHIDMELSKLKMYFAIQGQTFLYVDPSDFTNNYLDLSFMETK